MFTAAALQREADKYDTCAMAVLKAALGLPIRGRAARERARRAAAALGLAPIAATALARTEANPVRVALDQLSAGVVRETLALALTDGLAGFPAHAIEAVADLLGVSEAETLGIVARAREQLASTSESPVSSSARDEVAA